MAEFLEVHCYKSAEELLAAVTPWSPHYKLDGYIFRGHSSDSYNLLPVAVRSSEKNAYGRQPDYLCRSTTNLNGNFGKPQQSIKSFASSIA